MSCVWCVALAHRGSGGDLAGLCKFVGIYYMGEPQGEVVATHTAARASGPTYGSSVPVAVVVMQRSVLLRRRLNPYPAASLPSPDALFSTGLVVCVKVYEC